MQARPQNHSIGNVTYRLTAIEQNGRWIASAVRTDTEERFSVDMAGASESDAIAAMIRWLEWQRDHAAALEALQQAEHAYHRTIAGSAFASLTEGPSALELQKESLERVEAARLRLDDIRARKPG